MIDGGDNEFSQIMSISFNQEIGTAIIYQKIIEVTPKINWHLLSVRNNSKQIQI